MGVYRKEWPCCGDVSETNAWEPESCPFCSLAAAEPAPTPAAPVVAEGLTRYDPALESKKWDQYVAVMDASECGDYVKFADVTQLLTAPTAHSVRDVLEQAAKIAMGGPLIESCGAYPYMGDDCKAMALTVSNRIRAIKVEP